MVASGHLERIAMKNSSTFRLTFHVSHPSAAAAEIVAAFGLPARYAQSVGMPKQTKTGKLLGGVYQRTNVSFTLHEHPLNFQGASMESLIRESLTSFDRNYLLTIHETSGSCHFLVGVFSSENVMFDISLDAINELAASNVSIKFDFYGGEE